MSCHFMFGPEASDLSGIDRRGSPISKRVDARRQRERGRRKDETRVGRAPAPPLRQPNLSLTNPAPGILTCRYMTRP